MKVQDYNVGEPRNEQGQPVDEINPGTMLTTDYPTDILEMHRRISDGMILGELPFVYETAIYENPLRLEVAVGDIEENALVTFIKSQKEEVWAVMEETGHYHWPILLFLYEHGIKVSCVNSLRMKKYCSQSIRRAKTDANDKNSEIIRAFYAFVQNKLHFAVTGQTAAELIFSVYVRNRNMYQNLISKPKKILRANSKQPMR